MSQVTDIIEAQEKLYTLKDEIARRPGKRGKKSASGSSRADSGLKQIETSLYPVCVVCGERIEISRLQANAMEETCQSCANRKARR